MGFWLTVWAATGGSILAGLAVHLWDKIQRNGERKRSHILWRSALTSDLLDNLKLLDARFSLAGRKSGSWPPKDTAVLLKDKSLVRVGWHTNFANLKVESWSLLGPSFMSTCDDAQEALDFARAFAMFKDCIPAEKTWTFEYTEPGHLPTPQILAKDGIARDAIPASVFRHVHGDVRRLVSDIVVRFGTEAEAANARKIRDADWMGGGWTRTDTGDWVPLEGLPNESATGQTLL